MTNSEVLSIISCVILICLSLTLLAISPEINRWEKEHNYPYGKLCDFYRTCGEWK